MLSVKEAAEQLGVTPSRVRALISCSELPAAKVGRSWAINEADVLQRASEHRRAGRPKSADAIQGSEAAEQNHAHEPATELAEGHELYLACKDYFRFRPDADLLRSAKSREESLFYVTVADFFLQSRQRELIDQGVF